MCIKVLFPRMIFYTQVFFFICMDEEYTQFWANVLLYEVFMMGKKPSILAWCGGTYLQSKLLGGWTEGS